jgi:hypothetical protein
VLAFGEFDLHLVSVGLRKARDRIDDARRAAGEDVPLMSAQFDVVVPIHLIADLELPFF